MANHTIDTDIIRDVRKLWHLILAELTPHADGCLLYPEQTILASCRGYDRSRAISVARIVWAWAHPEGHLGQDDIAVHTCSFGMRGRWATAVDPRVCCNASHIIKRSRSYVEQLLKETA